VRTTWEVSYPFESEKIDSFANLKISGEVNITSAMRVISIDGQQGFFVDPSQWATGQENILVQLDDGRRVVVPADLLQPEQDGSYRLQADLSQVDLGADTLRRSGDPSASQDEVLVLPVTQEEAQVEKRQVGSGGVRVTTHVESEERIIDEPGFSEEVEITRIPINRVVDTAPEPYQNGDTLVIPILEEVLIVEKRLVLKEELRVTKHRRETRNPQRVTLRRVDASVEPLPPENH
jgi:uncharacterized protein (TIGR02271 family)